MFLRAQHSVAALLHPQLGQTPVPEGMGLYFSSSVRGPDSHLVRTRCSQNNEDRMSNPGKVWTSIPVICGYHEVFTRLPAPAFLGATQGVLARTHAQVRGCKPRHLCFPVETLGHFSVQELSIGTKLKQSRNHFFCASRALCGYLMIIYLAAP